MSFQNKTILVVGASGSLGSLLAEELASRGARVLGTASSNGSSQKIPSSCSMKLLLDLSSQASIETLAKYLVANEPIDGVVLAAGRVGFGRTTETTAEQAALLNQINYLGQASLLSQIASKLQPESFVAAITGVVAEKAFPGMAAYCASKAAMSSWLGAAGLELRRQGTKVIELRPGHTETGLATRPLFGAAPAMPEGMDPRRVVEKVIEAIETQTALVSSSEF